MTKTFYLIFRGEPEIRAKERKGENSLIVSSQCDEKEMKGLVVKWSVFN